MRVLKKRWGEVSIKKQGAQKNQFDKTCSFSITQTNSEYTIEELKNVLEIAVNLTERYNHRQLVALLRKMTNGHARKESRSGTEEVSEE